MIENLISSNLTKSRNLFDSLKKVAIIAIVAKIAKVAIYAVPIMRRTLGFTTRTSQSQDVSIFR